MNCSFYSPSLLHSQCPPDALGSERKQKNNTINHLLGMASAFVFYIMRTGCFFCFFAFFPEGLAFDIYTLSLDQAH